MTRLPSALVVWLAEHSYLVGIVPFVMLSSKSPNGSSISYVPPTCQPALSYLSILKCEAGGADVYDVLALLATRLVEVT